MFELFSFRLTQLRAVKTAMDDFAAFMPDDKTAAETAAMVAEAEAALGNAEGAWTDLNLARGERDEKSVEGHDAAVDVFAVMKRRYRKDVASVEAISRLPVKDRSPTETLARMNSTSKLWSKLPNPPGALTVFKAWDAMGQTEFDALREALRMALEEVSDAEEAWDKADGDLKEMQDEIEDFVTTALVQGRAQFDEGTVERGVIDKIPRDERSTKTVEKETAPDAPKT